MPALPSAAAGEAQASFTAFMNPGPGLLPVPLQVVKDEADIPFLVHTTA